MVYADMPIVYERIEDYSTNVGQSDVNSSGYCISTKKI